MLSVRLVKADHYMSNPIPDLDVGYSDFRGCEVKQVPVIRIFGSSSAGQKVCLHIHGVFPYFYIPYDGCVEKQKFIYKVAAGIDKALNISLGNSNSNTQHVYKASLVSGIPFYGFHSKCHTFLKIYFYNPLVVKKASELLQNGVILGQVYQPHEAHVPFVLQFCMDYNLHGMSFINLASVRYRQGTIRGSDVKPLPLDNVPEELLLPSHVLRVSTCNLEVDAVAVDILNRLDISDQSTSNPGLKAIWEEEKERRRNENRNSQFTPQNSQIREVFPTPSELFYLDRLKKRLNEVTLLNENSEPVIKLFPGEKPKPYSSQTSEGEIHLEASVSCSHVESLCRAKHEKMSVAVNSQNLQFGNENDEILKVSSELPSSSMDSAVSCSQTSILDSQCLNLIQLLQDLVEDDSMLGSQHQNEENEEPSDHEQDMLSQTLESESSSPSRDSSNCRNGLVMDKRKFVCLPQLDGANDLLVEDDEDICMQRLQQTQQISEEQQQLSSVWGCVSGTWIATEMGPDFTRGKSVLQSDLPLINEYEGFSGSEFDFESSSDVDNELVMNQPIFDTSFNSDKHSDNFLSMDHFEVQSLPFFSESASDCPNGIRQTINPKCMLIGDTWLNQTQPLTSLDNLFCEDIPSSPKICEWSSDHESSEQLSESEKYFSGSEIDEKPSNEIDVNSDLSGSRNGNMISTLETKRRLSDLIKLRTKAKESMAKHVDSSELKNIDINVMNCDSSCGNDNCSSVAATFQRISNEQYFKDQCQVREETTLEKVKDGNDNVLKIIPTLIARNKNDFVAEDDRKLVEEFEDSGLNIKFDAYLEEKNLVTVCNSHWADEMITEPQKGMSKNIGLKNAWCSNSTSFVSKTRRFSRRKIHEDCGEQKYQMENNLKVGLKCQKNRKNVVPVRETLKTDESETSRNSGQSLANKVGKRSVKERLGILVRNSISRNLSMKKDSLQKKESTSSDHSCFKARPYLKSSHKVNSSPPNEVAVFCRKSNEFDSQADNLVYYDSDEKCVPKTLRKYSKIKCNMKTVSEPIKNATDFRETTVHFKKEQNVKDNLKVEVKVDKTQIGLYVKQKLGLLVESRSKASSKCASNDSQPTSEVSNSYHSINCQNETSRNCRKAVPVQVSGRGSLAHNDVSWGSDVQNSCNCDKVISHSKKKNSYNSQNSEGKYQELDTNNCGETNVASKTGAMPNEVLLHKHEKLLDRKKKYYKRKCKEPDSKNTKYQCVKTKKTSNRNNTRYSENILEKEKKYTGMQLRHRQKTINVSEVNSREAENGNLNRQTCSKNYLKTANKLHLVKETWASKLPETVASKEINNSRSYNVLPVENKVTNNDSSNDGTMKYCIQNPGDIKVVNKSEEFVGDKTESCQPKGNMLNSKLYLSDSGKDDNNICERLTKGKETLSTYRSRRKNQKVSEHKAVEKCAVKNDSSSGSTKNTLGKITRARSRRQLDFNRSPYRKGSELEIKEMSGGNIIGTSYPCSLKDISDNDEKPEKLLCNRNVSAVEFCSGNISNSTEVIALNEKIQGFDGQCSESVSSGSQTISAQDVYVKRTSPEEKHTEEISGFVNSLFPQINVHQQTELNRKFIFPCSSVSLHKSPKDKITSLNTVIGAESPRIADILDYLSENNTQIVPHNASDCIYLESVKNKPNLPEIHSISENDVEMVKIPGLTSTVPEKCKGGTNWSFTIAKNRKKGGIYHPSYSENEENPSELAQNAEDFEFLSFTQRHLRRSLKREEGLKRKKERTENMTFSSNSPSFSEHLMFGDEEQFEVKCSKNVSKSIESELANKECTIEDEHLFSSNDHQYIQNEPEYINEQNVIRTRSLKNAVLPHMGNSVSNFGSLKSLANVDIKQTFSGFLTLQNEQHLSESIHSITFTQSRNVLVNPITEETTLLSSMKIPRKSMISRRAQRSGKYSRQKKSSHLSKKGRVENVKESEVSNEAKEHFPIPMALRSVSSCNKSLSKKKLNISEQFKDSNHNKNCTSKLFLSTTEKISGSQIKRHPRLESGSKGKRRKRKSLGSFFSDSKIKEQAKIPCLDGTNDSIKSHVTKETHCEPKKGCKRKIHEKENNTFKASIKRTPENPLSLIHRKHQINSSGGMLLDSESSPHKTLKKYLSIILGRQSTKQSLLDFLPKVMITRLKTCTHRNETISIFLSRERKELGDEMFLCRSCVQKKRKFVDAHGKEHTGVTQDLQLSKPPGTSYLCGHQRRDLLYFSFQPHSGCAEEPPQNPEHSQEKFESLGPVELDSVLSNTLIGPNCTKNSTLMCLENNGGKTGANNDISKSKDCKLKINDTSNKKQVDSEINESVKKIFGCDNPQQLTLVQRNEDKKILDEKSKIKTAVKGQSFYPMKNFMQTSSNLTLDDIKNLVILTPKITAPSRKQVFKTLSTLKLPKVTFQKPFFSNALDVVEKTEVGYKNLRVPSLSVKELNLFESLIPGLNGLNMYKNEVMQNLWEQSSTTCYNIESVLSGIHVKAAFAGQRETILTPCSCAPLVKDVKLWAKARLLYKENKKTNKLENEVNLNVHSMKEIIQATASSTSLASSQEISENDKKGVSLSHSSSENFSPTTINAKLDNCEKKEEYLRKSSMIQSATQNSVCVDESQGSGNRVERLMEESQFQRQMATPHAGNDSKTNDSLGYKMSFENLQHCRAVVEVQYLTVLVVEIHVQTRNELRPDPAHDPVSAVFYCIQNDVPEESLMPHLITGMIVVNCPTSKAHIPLIYDVEINSRVSFVSNEKMLMEELVQLVQFWDPDILAGYEVEMLSWGYLFERAFNLEINLCSLVSRIPSIRQGNKNRHSLDESVVELPEEFTLLGRIMLNAWRLMRHEVALQSYTFENVSFHVLHERIPLVSFKTLTQWWGHRTKYYWGRVANHYLLRVKGLINILEQLDLINRTSELARIFGIQFYEVLSRGSQFRVESMMLRMAKPSNFIPVSPSIEQRAHMRAPECLQLIMEPESQLYVDPIIVLDFQSLYPSMIIAYNYCYSTCLGRVEHLGQATPFEFGCSRLVVPPDEIKNLVKSLNISPCGVAFVKPNIRRGILPRMLEEILETRLMVKKSMKEHKDHKTLQRVLHSRQLGLKLIANVTYGYTAANFSGRMACVEVGDSVVSKGRETLQRAIHLVENTSRWNAHVVYGDTDSLFVLVRGRSREEAFVIGSEIAEAVTKDNPSPVKLKLEKVYQPCILQTKKRYVGYMYESADQKEPVYDAKGIETVRRDGCPVVAKVLKKSLSLLFESKDISKVKSYVQWNFSRILERRMSIQDLTFAREYRGSGGYKRGACVPALELTKRWLSVDPRAEPRVSERVPYIIISGAPNVPLIQLVRSPYEVLAEPSLHVHSHYYVSRVLCPPLARCFSLLGVDVSSWYSELPRRMALTFPKLMLPKEDRKITITQYFSKSNCIVCYQVCQSGLCTECQSKPQLSTLILTEQLHEWERHYYNLEKICQSCYQYFDQIECISLDCPVMYHRTQAKHNLQQEAFIRNLQENSL